jgi:hypothetical protein
MHIRLSTVRRGDKTYRYAQLVESFRREDGRPTHRILASFGALDDQAIANLRGALEANRSGDALVVTAKAPVSTTTKPVVQANYRYLDLAVLLRVWRQAGLAGLLADLLPEREQSVGADQVVAALVLHRCIAPGSKLAAERWFPGTALAELLAVAPEQFNNSRVHRALASLEAVEGAIQARLPGVVQRTEGACVRLFIDATDTWIVGTKLPLAAEGKDKEGIFRRRIGIVLLCDQRGYPLRWTTLSGRYHDGTALLEMATAAAKLDWVGDKPIILDRAVGTAGAIERLTASGLRYLTALPWSEFNSSGAPIPWAKVAALQAACEAPGASQDSLAAAGVGNGFTHPRADRFVLDLGVFDKAAAADTEGDSAVVVAMRFALQLDGLRGAALREVAERHSNTTRSARKHRLLLGLSTTLRHRVLAGQADSLGVNELCSLARLPEADQISAFEKAIARQPSRRVKAKRTAPSAENSGLRARGVLYFNPDRFRAARAADEAGRARVLERVASINLRLASSANRRTDASALAEAHRAILKAKLGSALAPRMEKKEGYREVVLDLDQDAWNRRRQVDGLALLTTHPDVVGTPAEIIAMYFEKDVVEKDFQTIKSSIELRPVHHYTDIKLRAHVTVCMLALLLQRVLGRRLHATGMTASAALEVLGSAHLNLIAAAKAKLYTITQLNEAQQGILAALNMAELANDQEAAKSITPR